MPSSQSFNLPSGRHVHFLCIEVMIFCMLLSLFSFNIVGFFVHHMGAIYYHSNFVSNRKIRMHVLKLLIEYLRFFLDYCPQVRMKAVCVLESILRKRDNDNFSTMESYFSKNKDLVVRCCESPQSSLREKANKVKFYFFSFL